MSSYDGTRKLPDRLLEDQETSSMEAHDRVLLQALQDFVVPLIRTMDQTIQINNNELPLGSEAGKLITALHEFISSIVVRSQSRTQNLIKVSLDEEEKKLADDLKDTEEKQELSTGVGVILPSARIDAQNEDTLEKAEPTFHDKLMSALREHVFNVMPIRLLCFEPHGSSLQITLVGRDTIHRRLESILRAKMRQPDHLQNMIDVGSDGPVKVTTAEREDKAIQHLISQCARYAILSHTWLRTSREVTYSDWNTGDFDAEEPGYRKLVNFCKVVWKDHGVAYGWMDTICINKESSSELDESIRSMYNWYNRADICIIYLGDTASLSDMHTDAWFTRGWTLQELIAPDVVKFYNGAWRPLVAHSDNDKTNAETVAQIERATSISPSELYSIRYAPISRRMQMAAARKVTREEDTAYSLMGIFDVSFSTAYGEGAQRAFFRLLQAVLASPTYHILDIFNWAGALPLTLLHKSRVLPSSPAYYLCRSVLSGGFLLGQPIGPLTLTHVGLRVPVVLMPAL
ncbi:heterokaryon incompatibility protein-domain-containing protein, partial [Pholiota molesta]